MTLRTAQRGISRDDDQMVQNLKAFEAGDWLGGDSNPVLQRRSAVLILARRGQNSTDNKADTYQLGVLSQDTSK